MGRTPGPPAPEGAAGGACALVVSVAGGVGEEAAERGPGRGVVTAACRRRQKRTTCKGERGEGVDALAIDYLRRVRGLDFDKGVSLSLVDLLRSRDSDPAHLGEVDGPKISVELLICQVVLDTDEKARGRGRRGRCRSGGCREKGEIQAA